MRPWGVGLRAILMLAVAILASIRAIALVSVEPAGHAGFTPTPRPIASRPLAASAPGPDDALATALGRALPHEAGNLAVGVADLETGVTATFHGDQSFHAESVVEADILAALLLQHQQVSTPLSAAEQEFAAHMIEDSDNVATTDLWDDDEGEHGIAAADSVLGLRHTVPGRDAWSTTTTTATDQLRLLTDLTSARSPLAAPARQYELGLMRNVPATQSWGVGAAADAGTHPAVKSGCLADGASRLWTADSIGVISHAHRQFLVVVLSDSHLSESAGIQVVQTAAKAAASSIVGR